MKVNELYRYLDTAIPSSLSCEWDNDGLMCCPDGNKEIRKVLVALDVTADVIDEAISGGYDVIISHHPFIFSGIKALNDGDFIARKVIKVMNAGIAVMSFHTRLDAVSGGVNDKLVELLGLENAVSFGEGDEQIGRIGELRDSISAELFAKKVKEALGTPAVLYADSKKAVKRVAVIGGDGGDFVGAAMKAGADTYLSGRLKYHHMTDAPDLGINLLEAGHFYTEDPVCKVLCEMLAKVSVEAVPYFSNRIKAL